MKEFLLEHLISFVSNCKSINIRIMNFTIPRNFSYSYIVSYFVSTNLISLIRNRNNDRKFDDDRKFKN